MLPPPLTILHVPPPGVPVNVFVEPSQIDAVLVVLLAATRLVTVNERLLILAGHPPLAGIVYLTVTVVFDPTLGAV